VEVDGKLEMPVDVYLPQAKNPSPVVMLAHGFTQSKKFHANQGRHLAAEGYVVLVPSLQRFANHAGHARDLLTLLDWAGRGNVDKTSPLFGRVDAGRAAACGHSAGGLSALLAASADGRIRVLVLLDAVDVNGSGAKAAAKLKIPSLSICAEASAWNANGSPEKLAATLPEPKKTIKIAGANHLEAQDPVNPLAESVLGKVNPQRQQRFTDEMTLWLKKHLPVAKPVQPAK
jgi:dienelactone hydrolase